MRIVSYLKQCVVMLLMVSVAALPLWLTGCAKETTTVSKPKPSAGGSTTGPGAEVPEPVAEEKKSDEPKSEEKSEEKPKEETKEEAKSEEKKPE